MKSIFYHTLAPLLWSLLADFILTIEIDQLLIAFNTFVFAIYQHIIDTKIMRDRPPSREWGEFSIYIIIYSVVGLWL